MSDSMAWSETLAFAVGTSPHMRFRAYFASQRRPRGQAEAIHEILWVRTAIDEGIRDEGRRPGPQSEMWLGRPFGTDLTVPGYPAAALRALVPVRFLRAPVIGLATVDPARVRVASRDRHLSR